MSFDPPMLLSNVFCGPCDPALAGGLLLVSSVLLRSCTFSLTRSSCSLVCALPIFGLVPLKGGSKSWAGTLAVVGTAVEGGDDGIGR